MTRANAVRSVIMQLPRRLLMALVRLYQLTLSPFIGGQCRFHPTCSHYAMDALEQHGAWRGSILAAGRLLRCQPWCEGGIDPVPPSLNHSCVSHSGENRSHQNRRSSPSAQR